MTFTLLIAAFAAILLVIVMLTLIAGLVRAVRGGTKPRDPTILDSRDLD